MPHSSTTATKVGVRDAAGRFIDTFDIMVQLPWGAVTSMVVHHDFTVSQLKSVIELKVGLPADLLTIGYRRHHALDDHVTLRQLRMIPGDKIVVIIEYGFDELVSGAVSGSTQKVINDINKHWNDHDVARRRMVVMFISAHRGFHYLVERMLTDGVHPDMVTPSGRTALHIACAMGNGGCIDALLQRGANTTLTDAENKTPVQVAFSCGQQEAERRLVLYERARSRQARQPGKKGNYLQTTCKGNSSSWSRSPRFPVSRLARSVTPTLALQEMSFSPPPGPELHVKSVGGANRAKKALNKWSVRRLTQADIGHQSESSEESVDSEPAKEADLPTFDDMRFDACEENGEVAMTPDSSRPTSVLEETLSNVTSSTMSPRPPAIRPPHMMSTRTTAWQSETRKVRFDESPRTQVLTRSYSAPLPKSLGNGSQATFIDDTPTSCVRQSVTPSSSRVSVDEKQNGAQESVLSMLLREADQGSVSSTSTSTSRSTRPRAKSARPLSLKYSPRNPDDRYGRDNILDIRRVKDVQAFNEVCVGLRETTEQPFLSNGRRKATPEENCAAFNDWLESKVQGAKDRKLLNNVQILLDDAFGRADEEMKKQEEKRPKKSGQSYEDWKKHKNDEKANKRKELLHRQQKDEEKRRQQESVDAENELLIKAWIMRKNEMERQQRASQSKEKREKYRKLVEQQQAAQQAFEKWRLNKEWDELVSLREGQAFFDKSLKTPNQNSGKRPIKKRAQSAPTMRGSRKVTAK